MANRYEQERKGLADQIRELLPLIEMERAAYIRAEGGRLAAIIGTGYWDKKIEDHEIFHGRRGDDLALIEDRVKDPYDITIEEMDWITRQYKKIQRVGTDTYTSFFHMLPEDKERIGLLARMWHKITHDTLCTETDIRELVEGHDAFIDRKLTDPVKVVGR